MSDSIPEIDAATPAEFRQWLDVNHAVESNARLILHKKSSGEQSMTLGEAID